MRILHIIATPRSHESNTIRVSNAILEELYLKYSDLSLKVFDLFKVDLPAVAGQNIESKYKLMTGQQLEGAQKSSWKEIETNIELFLDTDIYLITTPMWNFGIPYALKYYIDAIVQPGFLYRYNEFGIPEGLIKGKKMICVTSRGGDYSAGSPLHSFDFVEPYLRAIFNFVGITDIHFINAEPMDISIPLRRTAILNAIEKARELVRRDNIFELEPGEKVEFIEGIKPAPLQE
jgi:FMN-dependent NADH-azoreductase